MSDFPEDVEWPDGEKVAGELLRPLVVHDNDIGNFLIVNYTEQIANHDTPFITIRERGGYEDVDDFTSYQNIEVSCWGKSRNVARTTARKALAIMLNAGGEEVNGITVDSTEDVTGAEEPMLDNPDNRCVTRLIKMAFRPIYGD